MLYYVAFRVYNPMYEGANYTQETQVEAESPEAARDQVIKTYTEPGLYVTVQTVEPITWAKPEGVDNAQG